MYKNDTTLKTFYGVAAIFQNSKSQLFVLYYLSNTKLIKLMVRAQIDARKKYMVSGGGRGGREFLLSNRGVS